VWRHRAHGHQNTRSYFLHQVAKATEWREMPCSQQRSWLWPKVEFQLAPRLPSPSIPDDATIIPPASASIISASHLRSSRHLGAHLQHRPCHGTASSSSSSEVRLGFRAEHRQRSKEQRRVVVERHLVLLLHNTLALVGTALDTASARRVLSDANAQLLLVAWLRPPPV
jgi:hypothetical protein